MAPALAFVGVLVLAALGIMGELVGDVIPDSWNWAKDWRIVGSTAVILAMLAAAVAALTANRGASPSLVTVNVTPGGTAPEPTSTGKPDQLVVGDLPGALSSFQDRPELAEVRAAFGADGQVVVCVLTGARGVGKTQIAAAYAREQARSRCPLVAWVSAENTDRLVADLAEVARAVGVADPKGDSTKSASCLRAHLQARRYPAVLVIDNAVDADQLRRYVPVTGATQVIVTSTDHAVAGLGIPVDVSVFTREQSLTYLRARTRPDDEESAGQVADELGDLPLALAHAASVINEEQLSCSDYLARLRDLTVAETLPRPLDDPYPKGTAEAILLSVQAAENADESGMTSRLLGALAVLSPTGVHRALLCEFLNHGDGDPAGVARVGQTLARLVRLSLLVWGESGTSVIMHRLDARIVREGRQAAGRLAATILDVAEALTPLLIPEDQAWAQRERGAELVAHTLTLWDILLRLASDQPLATEQIVRCAVMANWVVDHLTATADLSRAARIGAQVLSDCERVLGADHPDTLDSRNSLAYAYQKAGRLDEAILLHETTLADRKRVLGADHPSTLTSRNNLAGAYESKGQLDEAIQLHETTLDDRERVLGADGPGTLRSRNNLAGAYQSAGRLDEAIQLYETTFADRERVLGADHPSTLTSRNNLAYAYQKADRLDDAIPLYETTFADRKRVLGADHPSTLTSRNNLAGAYQSAGRPGKAIQLYEATLADCELVLGADHPDTLGSRNNLADAYESAGRLDAAIQLYEATLADCERALGTDHPTTVTVRGNLRRAQSR